MEQFSLEKYIENPSRKVVTRDGRPVRIVCWDAPTKNPIYGFVEGDDGITCWRKDGRFSNLIDNLDLFFVDEKEELTEFEKALLAAFDCVAAKAVMTINQPISFQEDVKEWSKELLNLARKEIEKDIEHSAVEFAKSYMEDVNPSFEKVKESEELWKWKMSCLSGINKAYKQGKQDALKDLPKWKKVNVFVSDEFGLATRDDDLIITWKGYQIKLSDLTTLPKEE